MREIKVKVNGKDVPLSDFPKEFIIDTICAMLKSLKGVDEIKDVDIKIKI